MDIAIIILSFLAITLISNVLAFLVSHSNGIPEVKPFNCYACLSFWLTLIMGCAIAYKGEDTYTRAVLGYLSLVSAFMNYFYSKSKYHTTL